MKVAIIGCGSGVTAMAADLSLQGHEVNLFEFPEFVQNIEPILKSGNMIEIEGIPPMPKHEPFVWGN